MMSSGNVQWLLGLAIVVVGTFLLFDQSDKVVISDQINRPIEPYPIPPPADLPIKPVDIKTKACMADMACMQDFFLKVTLGNEYEPRDGDDPRINKWQTPVVYRVYGEDRLDQGRSTALKDSLEDIKTIASLVDLKLSSSVRGINVVVLLTADLETDLEGRFSELAEDVFLTVPDVVERMTKLRQSSTVCGGLASTKDSGTIGFIRMYLSPEIDQWFLKRCVYEEFSQMLGLYADVADDIDSLYTDQADRRQLTAFDFLLLRLLYHPMIEPGMTRDEVINVFPDVYRQTIAAPVAEKSF